MAASADAKSLYLRHTKANAGCEDKEEVANNANMNLMLASDCQPT